MFLLNEIRERTETDNLDTLYPDNGPLARHKYVKHLKMLAAGKTCNERCCLGGNRVGKTHSIGCYETTLHLTGNYPHWWDGWVVDKPMLAWASGTSSKKTRDVNQKMLFGDIIRGGRPGMVPKSQIVRYTRKTSVADAVDQIVIKHKKGWENTLTLKSYEEGRTSFEAEAVDWIWLDEEPPRAIYDECLMRLLTTGGRLLATMTPLQGISETVMAMLEDTDLLS